MFKVLFCFSFIFYVLPGSFYPWKFFCESLFIKKNVKYLSFFSISIIYIRFLINFNIFLNFFFISTKVYYLSKSTFFAMYGLYSYPFHIEMEGITIDVTEKNGIYNYIRECCGKKFKTLIAADKGKIHINPVEPVNLPQNITRFLEIDIDRILIAPNTEEKLYLTFPIEIGVFLESGNDIEIVDLFTRTDPKYSLYGTPTDGNIVRYSKSSIYKELPEIDILKEGVLEFNIINNDSSIHSVSKAVFDGYGMKMYYGEDLVSMIAHMKIYQKNNATTEFLNLPILPDMEKSIELYMTRNISVMKKNYMMEWGFD